MKSVSHGILLLDTEAEILLCHSTGNKFWDIPKGGAEPGESPVEAALREAREECGVRLSPTDLHPLGHFPYRSGKDLVLHAALIERIDTGRCSCSSLFQDRWGRTRPEMDDFRWTPFGEVETYCAKAMAAVLTERVSLPKLLEWLGARTRPVVPVMVLAPPGA